MSDLQTAGRIVQATGRDTVGILVDTLHYARDSSAAKQFKDLPTSRFPFVYVCDAPVGTSWTPEELFHAGRVERLPPGKGGIDILAIVQHCRLTSPSGSKCQ